jgi:hypothetical protein
MMTPTTDGVVLAGAETGSRLLHRLLAGAAARFPELQAAQLPASPGAFKQGFSEAVVRFEATRVASPARLAIAAGLREATFGSLALARQGAETPLLEALATEVAAPPTDTLAGTGPAGLVPQVTLDGRTYRGEAVLEAVDLLLGARQLTDAAARGLRWVVAQAQASGGALTLAGRRFVVLGAAAELSPASLLAQAGATVRWVDVKPPAGPPPAGALVVTRGGDDLLADPRAVLAAVRAFAHDGPVHLGLFAYAPGASRELRLEGAMDALVEVLGPQVVASVSLLVSPTSPAEVQPEDVAAAAGRAQAAAGWQRALQAVGVLQRPGHLGAPGPAIARAIIGLQGSGYQAAQYLTKLLSAEVLATRGLGGRPLTVSANVAGITATRSLSHPVFQLGFAGASRFGIRVFEPEATRALSGLLMLHDLLNPLAPGAAGQASAPPLERARAIRAQQVHGGVYGQPWGFESVVRVGAVVGALTRPGLLLPQSRRR